MYKNITAMADRRLVKLLICSLALLICPVHGAVSDQLKVPITILENATEFGAVCLDGSPPAYYHDEGSGEGANNWVVYLEGGEWCSSNHQCHDDPGFTRFLKKTWNCSADGCANSYQRDKTISFEGILSGSQLINPDFYNWNRVHIVYCDGGSFSGDVEEVDSETPVHRRGARIFTAVINNLKSKGLETAKQAVLTGTSAGGLATLLNCDKFRNAIPDIEQVKCVADSGYFIHAKNYPAAVEIREAYYNAIVAYHGMEQNLPQECTSTMPAGSCLFADNLIQHIKTPVFIIDSTYDSYQLNFRVWNYGYLYSKCVLVNPKYCGDNATLIQPIQDWRAEFIKALPKCGSTTGMFIDTCQVHGHGPFDKRWNVFTVKNKTLNKAVGDWYFDRSDFCEIDTEHNFIQFCNTSAPDNW